MDHECWSLYDRKLKIRQKMAMTVGKENRLRGGTSYSIQLFYF